MMAFNQRPNTHSIIANVVVPLFLWQKSAAFSLITVFLVSGIRSVKDSSFVGDTEHCLE